MRYKVVNCPNKNTGSWTNPPCTFFSIDLFPLPYFFFLSTGAVYLTDDRWHHVCITWENVEGEWTLYKDGQRAAGGASLNIHHVVKPGGVAVLGQDQDVVGGGFHVGDAFTGELAEMNLWDVVLSAADIADQFRNCYIPHGSVIQWSQFKPKGEVDIKKYKCTLTSGKYTFMLWMTEHTQQAARASVRMCANACTARKRIRTYASPRDQIHTDI